MKPFHKLMVQLIAETTFKNNTSFSDQELDSVRNCIKQNPALEDKFFHLKHKVFTLTSDIGRELKKDPTLYTYFPEYSI
jgi:hypothetical protein